MDNHDTTAASPPHPRVAAVDDHALLAQVIDILLEPIVCVLGLGVTDAQLVELRLEDRHLLLLQRVRLDKQIKGKTAIRSSVYFVTKTHRTRYTWPC